MDAAEHVRKLMKEQQVLLDGLAEFKTFLLSAESEGRAKMEEIDAKIAALVADREAILNGLRAENADVYDLRDQLQAEADRKEEELRRACQNLPLDLSRDGATFREGRLRVSVSKSTTQVTYREELLRARPDFMERYVDGDPLVKSVIDPIILERLIARGEVKAEDVDKFKIETRVRTPQVRIVEVPE